MTDAPKRIWASAARPGYGEWQDIPYGLPSPHEYHLARPGQPCSDLEFMQRLQASSTPPNGYVWLVARWVGGDFTAAMEGLE